MQEWLRFLRFKAASLVRLARIRGPGIRVDDEPLYLWFGGRGLFGGSPCSCLECRSIAAKVSPIRRIAESNREKKSVRLLLEVLEPQQRKTYNDEGYVVVNGKASRYYIACWWNGPGHNIARVSSDGTAVYTLCVFPFDRENLTYNGYPGPDIIAAQVLSLRHAEKHVLNIACRNTVHHQYPAPQLLPAI